MASCHWQRNQILTGRGVGLGRCGQKKGGKSLSLVFTTSSWLPIQLFPLLFTISPYSLHHLRSRNKRKKKSKADKGEQEQKQQQQPTKKSKAPLTLDLFALVPKKDGQQQKKKAPMKKNPTEPSQGKSRTGSLCMNSATNVCVCL